MIAPVREYRRERSLLEPPRPTDVLHPSEISQDGWCPRAAYFKLKSPPPPDYISPRMQNVFDYGHDVHEAIQADLADMGKLEGFWRCRTCGQKFYRQGRAVCRACNGTSCKYLELALSDPELMISGHTDGLLWQDKAIMEVKTVGEGTVRYYAPQLVAAHTYKVDGKDIVDLNGLWDSIRRPFGSHLRQGTIYTYLCRQRKRVDKPDKIVFVYESKMNQDRKEFLVKYNQTLIEPVLAGARAVANAMRGEGPIPGCRGGSQPCVACLALEGAVL